MVDIVAKKTRLLLALATIIAITIYVYPQKIRIGDPLEDTICVRTSSDIHERELSGEEKKEMHAALESLYFYRNPLVETKTNMGDFMYVLVYGKWGREYIYIFPNGVGKSTKPSITRWHNNHNLPIKFNTNFFDICMKYYD